MLRAIVTASFLLLAVIVLWASFIVGTETSAGTPRFSAIRDGKDPMPARKVADIADDGVVELAKALGQPTERHLASLIRYRNPSLEGQEHRYYGNQGGGPRPAAPTAEI